MAVLRQHDHQFWQGNGDLVVPGAVPDKKLEVVEQFSKKKDALGMVSGVGKRHTMWQPL